MHPVQLILPSIATLILGTAILLPLRDAKREARGEPKPSVTETEPRRVLEIEARAWGSQQAPPHQQGQTVDVPLELTTIDSVQDRPDERVVPITRRRLRSGVEHVGWPTLQDAAQPPDDSEDRLRHLMALLSDVTSDVPEALLVLAYREEVGKPRRLALTRLARGSYEGCADLFVDALRNGDDEERLLAIDGLVRLGVRDELTRAFDDRVEAIAARAALAFVGSRRRAEFVAVLDRYVDAFRRNAILDCLAGLIE